MDGSNFRGGKRVNGALDVLHLNIEVGAMAREAADRTAIAKFDRDQLIARRNVFVRVQERFLDFDGGHFPGDVR
jgi:hypothetical protein